MNQTRIHCACEFSEFGDKTNISLRHRLVGIGADDAARNGTTETDAGTKGVDCDMLAPLWR